MKFSLGDFVEEDLKIEDPKKSEFVKKLSVANGDFETFHPEFTIRYYYQSVEDIQEIDGALGDFIDYVDKFVRRSIKIPDLWELLIISYRLWMMKLLFVFRSKNTVNLKLKEFVLW